MKLKLFSLFFLLFIFSGSFAAQPWEISADQQKWNWTQVALGNRDDPNPIKIYADFTKMEKTPNGDYVFPEKIIQLKDNQTNTQPVWAKFDCSSKSVFILGEYKNGKFDFSRLMPTSSPINYVPYMICGIKINGDLIYGYKNYSDDILNLYWGWMPKDIQNISTSNETILSVKGYQYNPQAGSFLNNNSNESEINCSSEQIKDVTNKFSISPKLDSKYSDTIYFLDSVCSYYKNNMAHNLSNNKKLLNETKQKCIELGYKSGTEKFGSCVLELTK